MNNDRSVTHRAAAFRHLTDEMKGGDDASLALRGRVQALGNAALVGEHRAVRVCHEPAVIVVWACAGPHDDVARRSLENG